jgi:hypothetical protein
MLQATKLTLELLSESMVPNLHIWKAITSYFGHVLPLKTSNFQFEVSSCRTRQLFEETGSSLQSLVRIHV